MTPGSYPARIHVLFLIAHFAPPVVLRSNCHTRVVCPVNVTTTRGRVRLERRSGGPESRVPFNTPVTVTVTVTLIMADKVMVDDCGLVVVVSTSGGARLTGRVHEPTAAGVSSREAAKVVVSEVRVGVLVVGCGECRWVPQQNDHAEGSVPGERIVARGWHSPGATGVDGAS